MIKKNELELEKAKADAKAQLKAMAEKNELELQKAKAIADAEIKSLKQKLGKTNKKRKPSFVIDRKPSIPNSVKRSRIVSRSDMCPFWTQIKSTNSVTL